MSQNYLIIHQSGYQDRAFPLNGEEILIGRSAESSLTLPNVSVSRQHARILQRGATAFILDLGSENGTMINHEPLIPGEERKLGTGDAVQTGKFKLTFVSGEGQAQPVFNGRFVHHLPVYEAAVTRPQDDATFGLDAKTLFQMAEQEHLVDSARLVEAGSAANRWKLGKRSIIIGRGAEIPVSGWFVSGRTAELSWGGRAHTIKALSWWTRVFINGEKLVGKARSLKNGDRIRIGSKRFLYEVPTSERLKRMRARQRGRREQVQIPTRNKPAEG